MSEMEAETSLCLFYHLSFPSLGNLSVVLPVVRRLKTFVSSVLVGFLMVDEGGLSSANASITAGRKNRTHSVFVGERYSVAWVRYPCWTFHLVLDV